MSPPLNHPLIDIRGHCSYITKIARLRYEAWKNHSRNVDWGLDAQIVGVAGEIGTRIYYGKILLANVGRDYGCDLDIQGLKVNVISTFETPKWTNYRVQIPADEKITSDVYLYTMINLFSWQVRLIGYCSGREMETSPIIYNRPIPCRGVHVNKLHPVQELLPFCISA